VGKFVLLNTVMYAGGYDFSADINKALLEIEAEAKDATTFGSGGWTELLAGLRKTDFSMEGLWEAGTNTVDPEAFSQFGGTEQVHMLAPAGSEASVAYGWRAARFKYSVGGEVGEIAPFSLTSQGSGAQGAVRGQLAKAKGTVSATGQAGSVLTLGAVGAAQFVYAGLHVFGTPGTTITVQVQSAPLVNFASPTTRGTIGPVTAAGGTWMTRAAGAITDQFWRLNVSAITGTFTVAGWIAVGS
jgi:hypothetical protein